MFKTPHLNPLEWVSAIVLIVGGLNWGLVGLFEFDLVAEIFGETFGTTNWLTRTIYVIVGASAIYTLMGLLRMEAMTTRDQMERNDRGVRTRA
jgi:uncharacterized membrane protein YuzA (DUF378 family)